MIRLIITLLLISTPCRAAVYEQFPGFEELFKRADYVGIVTLGARDVPKDLYGRRSDGIGPHRFFQITSVITLKGKMIEGDVARLADRRIGVPPLGEILAPEQTFLVFLTGDSGYQSVRYQWDEIHAEGSVLPVSPKTNLHGIDPTKKFELFRQIVADYAAHCKEVADYAMKQQQFVEKFSKPPTSNQPAPAPESKPEGKEKP